MRFFSQSGRGYLSLSRLGFVAIFGLGLLRFLMEPMGVPISAGGRATSITMALLLALVAYAMRFGWRGGLFGDVLVLAFVLVIYYNLVLTLFLLASRGLGIETYYLDPAPIGADPSVARYLWAHFAVTPILLGMAALVSRTVYGVTRAVRRFTRGAEGRAASADASR